MTNTHYAVLFRPDGTSDVVQLEHAELVTPNVAASQVRAGQAAYVAPLDAGTTAAMLADLRPPSLFDVMDYDE